MAPCIKSNRPIKKCIDLDLMQISIGRDYTQDNYYHRELGTVPMLGKTPASWSMSKVQTGTLSLGWQKSMQSWPLLS